MCTWHYLHHHHLPPCPRAIDIVVHYSYCPDAIPTNDGIGGLLPCSRTTSSGSSYQPSTSRGGGSSWDDETTAMMQQMMMATPTYDDPCATGGCLVSPDCSSGGCQVALLGGRWTCCMCGGRGNEHRWCQHRMLTSPDTFCYHVCCTECRADPGPGSSPSSPSSSGASSSGTSKRRRQK